MPQPGFFNLDERYAKLNERDLLVKLNQITDWEAFLESLSAIRDEPRKSQASRKPCDVVLTCLLPAWPADRQAGVQDSGPSASV